MSRRVVRKLEICPKFRDFDMMGIVHNSVYLDWFERGRFQIMDDIITLEQSQQFEIAAAVRETKCVYERAIRNRNKLLLITRHQIDEPYTGKLLFTHELIDAETKIAHAFCECLCVLINPKTGELTRTPPEELRKKYLSIK